jgi:hypothetical protein
MTAEKINLTKDVFGISRDLPLSYTQRKNVDDRFMELGRDKHIVLFGSSKQGKTCLRKARLSEDEYIVVHCSNAWDILDLNAAILKQAGYKLTQSTTKTEKGKNKVLASFAASVFGIGSKIEGEKETEHQTTTVLNSLELDLEDVNDVILALREMGFNKYIVLEDFHYLKTETQKDFSVQLKAFHENSKLCFIIVGVWLEENRLIVYNGDLTGRVAPINVDHWSPEELREVIVTGEQLLNITFSDQFKDEIVSKCQESVYVLQEVCYQTCLEQGIQQTQDTNKEVSNTKSINDMIREIVNQQSGRYNSFLRQFADGFQDTVLKMHKWILLLVLISDIEQLEKGIRYSEIRKTLEDHHPRGENLNSGNVTQALQSTASLQIKHNVKPIVLDYDESALRLHVVDRGFLLWLNYQDRQELLNELGLPSST